MELRENAVKIKITIDENRSQGRCDCFLREMRSVSHIKAHRTQNSNFTELKAHIELKIHRMWMYRCFIYKTRACVSCACVSCASRTSRMSWSRSLPLLAGPETLTCRHRYRCGGGAPPAGTASVGPTSRVPPTARDPPGDPRARRPASQATPPAKAATSSLSAPSTS